MSELASTSRAQLRYIPEHVFGVTPTTADQGNLKTRELRFTGETLNLTRTKETSDEINKYRGASSSITTNAESGGGVNGHMQYGEYDPFLAALLQDTWKAFGTNGVSDPFDADVTATTITASAATTGNSAFTTLVPGQWFTLQKADSANHNKLFRVHPTIVPTATVLTLDDSTPAVAETQVTGVVLTASRLTNGTTQPSFTIEREVGGTDEFFAYRGQTLSSATLSVETAAKTSIEFQFMGRDAVRSEGATTLPGAVEPSQSYQIMSSVAGTNCAMWVNGKPMEDTFASSLSMSYDNALRAQNAICHLGAVGIGSGTIVLTISMEIYFAAGATLYEEFEKDKDVEFTFTTFDVDGNGYVFTLPKAAVSSYTANADSKDQDFMASIELTGLMHLSGVPEHLRGKVLMIDRVGAPLAN